ncbi:hypothetical protein Bcop_2348 [Bacteroides coprosuis DSM 18011]|uniref:Uncharacterized protein n=1 Tax=Bacteroides coprosuis DSM 18011 TaxID=679937 RepID=F3ZNG7_9BACE|nr:hypothetical protein Bcop_2348 [Bacteroides coprosuis DSM 18011]
MLEELNIIELEERFEPVMAMADAEASIQIGEVVIL